MVTTIQWPNNIPGIQRASPQNKDACDWDTRPQLARLPLGPGWIDRVKRMTDARDLALPAGYTDLLGDLKKPGPGRPHSGDTYRQHLTY